MVGWRSNVSLGGKHLVVFMKNFFLLEPRLHFTSLHSLWFSISP